jgi:isochorismate hydrolase
MKAPYFQENALEKQSAAFLERIAPYRRHLALPLNLERPALLVLDMQEYFLQPRSHAFIPSAPAILPNIRALITYFTSQNCPIFFTRHLNTPENAGMMANWWQDLIERDNSLSLLTQQLDTNTGLILEKSQYDAFFKTDLESLLKEQFVSSIVICGVMTHLCCETTARSAFIHGFHVWFTIDGTATYTPEHHLATLQNLAHGFSTPVLVSEVLNAIQG